MCETLIKFVAAHFSRSRVTPAITRHHNSGLAWSRQLLANYYKYRMVGCQALRPALLSEIPEKMDGGDLSCSSLSLYQTIQLSSANMFTL